MNEQSTHKKPFKYQQLLDGLLANGCRLPELFLPNDMNACRFAFTASNQPSHIPQYVSNPRRMLQDIGRNAATTSLLALSCFTTIEKAEAFYTNLRKAFRNAAVSIGDSLAQGILTNDDGMMTTPSNNGHFDFYEYEGCDLNNTFHVTKKLA
ncbi:MAG: hypothetical protein K6B13_07935 [Prevotella sp.]|nr:hypothetical protein [Prevotella sp.]